MSDISSQGSRTSLRGFQLVFVSAFFLAAASAFAAAPRADIIFLLADDLGYGDIGGYGQKEIYTPNLDRLARKGMRFTDHYSGHNVCAPSRYVLMTGTPPGHAYIRDNRGGMGALDGPTEAVETIDLGGGVRIELVLIRPGTFMMGSDKEGPVHQVTLTQPFYLGKFEVTQEQWQAVMGSNPSYFKGPKLPVANVSWDDCQDFLTKLREKTGRKFTLPTEAQWEYACRAGTTTRYSFGDSDAGLAEHGWYSVNSGAKNHPVGEKKSNPWGLYDMHGNVWEWCADRYGNYPSNEVSDPAGAASGASRVYRGGSWSNVAAFCGSADRDGNLPGFRFLYLGLRLALSAVP